MPESCTQSRHPTLANESKNCEEKIVTDIHDSIQQSVDSMTESWLHQIRAGDDAAWQRLSQVYRKLVIWWCVKSDVPRSDIEDLTQEVFISVQRGIGNYERNSFRGWLWAITKTRIIDYWRKNAKQPVAWGGSAIDEILKNVEAESSLKVHEVDLATKVLFDEIVSIVKSEFNETHWQAFWMRVVENRSAADVSEQLGVTRTVVHNATSRIRRRINEEFPTAQAGH